MQAQTSAAKSPADIDRTAPQHTQLSEGGGGNLLVAGLSRTVSETDLLSMFAPFGHVVRAIIMRDAITAQSRGFGFVLMSSTASADAALEALHGTMCGANRINVRRSVHNGRVVESNAVFVRNIPPGVTTDQIAERFSSVGAVRSVVFTPFVVGHAEAGTLGQGQEQVAGAQAAHVEYESIEEARQALEDFNLQLFFTDDPVAQQGLPSMLVKFAERYSDRKQRQHATASAAKSHAPAPAGQRSSHRQRDDAHGDAAQNSFMINPAAPAFVMQPSPYSGLVGAPQFHPGPYYPTAPPAGQMMMPMVSAPHMVPLQPPHGSGFYMPPMPPQQQSPHAAMMGNPFFMAHPGGPYMQAHAYPAPAMMMPQGGAPLPSPIEGHQYYRPHDHHHHHQHYQAATAVPYTAYGRSDGYAFVSGPLP